MTASSRTGGNRRVCRRLDPASDCGHQLFNPFVICGLRRAFRRGLNILAAKEVKSGIPRAGKRDSKLVF
jgi:hypothetical protein